MIDNDKCEAYIRIIKIEEDLIKDLLAENKKLRDALDRISEINYYYDYGIHRDIAIKALEEITPIE